MDGLLKVGGCDRPDRVADVIFVHGLDGDARATWHPKDRPDAFWPAWLGEDVPAVGVWSLGYAVSASAWKGHALPLADRATNVLDQLELDGIGRRPIVFICHSLGGLLVKQVLRSASDFGNPAWKAIATQTKALVFLSTPHSGANLASWVQYVGTLLRTTASVEELEAHHPRLRELNLWYRNHVADFDLATVVYCEKRPIAGILVVNETTADPGIVGVIPIPVDEDHVSICKPASKDSQIYRRVKRLVEDLKESVITTIEPPPNVIPPGTDANTLGIDQRHHWNIPERLSRFFTGRENLLKKIHQELGGTSAVALIGLSGIGKTQLALAYAETHRKDYTASLWVNASSEQELVSGFVALAELFGLPEYNAEDQNRAVDAVLKWLTTHNNWLLIFDNADNLDLVKPYMLQRCQGRVLLTTSEHAVGELAFPIEIPLFDKNVAALFLLHRAGYNTEKDAPVEEQQAAQDLAVKLGFLPLALAQAGAFIEESPSTPAEYLILYGQVGSQLRAQRGRLTTDHCSVTKTFSLAFDKVASANPAAADLLRLCAFLNPEQIAEEVIAEGATELGEVLRLAVRNPLGLVTTRSDACRYSLLAYERSKKYSPANSNPYTVNKLAFV